MRIKFGQTNLVLKFINMSSYYSDIYRKSKFKKSALCQIKSYKQFFSSLSQVNLQIDTSKTSVRSFRCVFGVKWNTLILRQGQRYIYFFLILVPNKQPGKQALSKYRTIIQQQSQYTGQQREAASLFLMLIAIPIGRFVLKVALSVCGMSHPLPLG